MSEKVPLVDDMAVLDLIARANKLPGPDMDDSLTRRARRIEEAALHIARVAREWGRLVEKEA